MSPGRRFRDRKHRGIFLIRNIPAEIGAVFWVAAEADTEKNDLARLSALIFRGAVTCACQSFSCFILS